MRDRLIEILRKPMPVIKGYATIGETRMSIVDAEHIANRLLAEGVIVPPCKVGQKVYIIGWCGDIEEFTVRDFHLCTNEKGDCLYRFRAVIGEKSDIHFTTHYIGDTVFLTKEQAKRALAERSENGKS